MQTKRTTTQDARRIEKLFVLLIISMGVSFAVRTCAARAARSRKIEAKSLGETRQVNRARCESRSRKCMPANGSRSRQPARANRPRSTRPGRTKSLGQAPKLVGAACASQSGSLREPIEQPTHASRARSISQSSSHGTTWGSDTACAGPSKQTQQPLEKPGPRDCKRTRKLVGISRKSRYRY